MYGVNLCLAVLFLKAHFKYCQSFDQFWMLEKTYKMSAMDASLGFGKQVKRN